MQQRYLRHSKEEEMSSSNLLGDGAVANKAASILNKTVSQSLFRSVHNHTVLYSIVLYCLVLC